MIRPWKWFAVGLFVVAVLIAQAPSTPGTPQAATGTVTVQVNGNSIGTYGIINFISTPGMIQGCAPNPTMARVDCTPAPDSTIYLQRSTDTSGVDHYLNATSPTNPGVVYQAQAAVPPQAYLTGMWWIVNLDVPINFTTGATPTLNVGALGPLSITSTCTTPCLLVVEGSTLVTP